MTKSRVGTQSQKSVRSTIAAAALATSMVISGIAEACLNSVISNLTLALSVRTLQSDLMVSALSCQTRELYNAFAIRYRPDLKIHGTALKTYFNNLHGDRAVKALHTYVTDLANYAAVRHAEDDTTFCSGTETAFRALLTEEQPNFQEISLAYAMRVSPTLRQEIVLAAGGGGCAVEHRSKTVVAGGVTILN